MDWAFWELVWQGGEGGPIYGGYGQRGIWKVKLVCLRGDLEANQFNSNWARVF